MSLWCRKFMPVQLGAEFLLHVLTISWAYVCLISVNQLSFFLAAFCFHECILMSWRTSLRCGLFPPVLFACYRWAAAVIVMSWSGMRRIANCWKSSRATRKPCRSVPNSVWRLIECICSGMLDNAVTHRCVAAMYITSAPCSQKLVDLSAINGDVHHSWLRCHFGPGSARDTWHNLHHCVPLHLQLCCGLSSTCRLLVQCRPVPKFTLVSVNEWHGNFNAILVSSQTSCISTWYLVQAFCVCVCYLVEPLGMFEYCVFWLPTSALWVCSAPCTLLKVVIAGDGCTKSRYESIGCLHVKFLCALWDWHGTT